MPELKDVQIVGPLGPLHHGPATAKGMCVLLLKPLLQDDPGYLELYKSLAIICLEPYGNGAGLWMCKAISLQQGL